MPLRRNSKPEHAPNKSNQAKHKQNPTQSQSSKQKEATSAITTMQNPTLSQSSKNKEATFPKATIQNPSLSKSSKNKESTNASAGKNAQMTQVICTTLYFLMLRDYSFYTFTLKKYLHKGNNR